MKIRYYWRLVTGRTDALNPAKLTLRNIWAVIQAFFRKLQGRSLPAHLYEQAIWRRLQVIERSPECWAKGNCVHCGCEMVGKTLEDRGCVEDPQCYPDIMTKKEWKTFKEANDIKIFNM